MAEVRNEKNAVSIYEWVCQHELPAYEERLRKLIEMGAPEVVINGQSKAVRALENREIQIGGNAKLAEAMVETAEVKRGRGGKQYVEFNGCIRYFPNAKYGRFISD